ncbi:MAG: hypothetical protein Satyrvirus35_4 [Satyrvirus sp.]|uniref:Uncharacterized protein n=1 Tax=Satyrvirus sp. TaxID=2487771 RepID=A0A3G5AF26_9VIRU|nr:MAG: hypothetical protein Satyrvirus35_4 [Satyrvirus sp.]
MSRFLLYIYFKIYQLYCTIWKLIFKKFSRVILVYYFDGNNLKNITMNYYFGIGLSKFRTGVFYLKIFDENGVNHIAFEEKITNIKNIVLYDPLKNPPRRKNITFLNDETSLEVDLCALDNYKMNIEKLIVEPICDLKKILKFLGHDCTHVKIIEMRPFSKTLVDINEIHINQLYY